MHAKFIQFKYIIGIAKKKQFLILVEGELDN